MLGEDLLWDAIADYEVNMITDSMRDRKVETTSKKRLGTRGLYWHAKKSTKLEVQLKNCKEWDNHQVWECQQKKKIIVQQADGLSEEGREAANGESNQAGDQTAKQWKNIQDMVGMGKDVNHQGLNKMLNGKKAGKQKGDDTREYEAARAHKVS